MLTDNNQIFRNWFVIIHRHPTKVSAQIIQCIIFERIELSITIYSMAILNGTCFFRSESNEKLETEAY